MSLGPHGGFSAGNGRAVDPPEVVEGTTPKRMHNKATRKQSTRKFRLELRIWLAVFIFGGFFVGVVVLR